MKVAMEAFYLELEAYINGGDGTYLDRVIEVARIASIEEAQRLLNIITADRTPEQMQRGANVLFQFAKMQHEMKYIDSLTGLYHFNYLSHIERATDHTQFQLFFFDLDNMKFVNDTLGHEKGNEHIIRFSTALKKSFRTTDTIVRYGGDEFVVIAHRGSLSVQTVTERLNNHLNEFDSQIPISYCTGVASNCNKSLMKTIRVADKAMYQMKKRRKHQC